MSVANKLEMQMLDLINQERANAGVNPLKFNGLLNDSSEDHSKWMLDKDQFSHAGENGSSASDRMTDAGYKFEGNSQSGENIAFQSLRGDPGLEDDVVDLHNSLMNSPGHRANILDPGFTEIGIGIEQGEFKEGGNAFDSVVVTQNFATSEADNSQDPTTPVVDAPDQTPTTPEPETPDTNPDVPVSDNPDNTPDTPDVVPTVPVADTPDEAPDMPDCDVPDKDPTEPVADTPDEAPQTPDGENPDQTPTDPVADKPEDTPNMPDGETPEDCPAPDFELPELTDANVGEWLNALLAQLEKWLTEAVADAGSDDSEPDTSADEETAADDMSGMDDFVFSDPEDDASADDEMSWFCSDDKDAESAADDQTARDGEVADTLPAFEWDDGPSVCMGEFDFA